MAQTSGADQDADHADQGGRRIFATTHWSVVLAAGDSDSPPARTALETLCRAYWYPIYVYVRRRGYGPEDAQDLTQGFFAHLIAKEHIRLADPQRGRFRTFLLAMLDYYLAQEWSRAHRQKRGGQVQFVSLDQERAEDRYRLEPVDNNTPEKKFVQQWALTALQNALAALQSECESQGKAALFTEIRGLLSGESEAGIYSEIAQRLAMNEGAVRVAVHRLRKRYGELLRQEIAQTVDGAAEVEDELRYLLAALRG
jgi:RNA polymerase sigma-70 factor (ECF subfamily)